MTVVGETLTLTLTLKLTTVNDDTVVTGTFLHFVVVVTLLNVVLAVVVSTERTVLCLYLVKTDNVVTVAKVVCVRLFVTVKGIEVVCVDFFTTLLIFVNVCGVCVMVLVRIVVDVDDSVNVTGL